MNTLFLATTALGFSSGGLVSLLIGLLVLLQKLALI